MKLTVKSDALTDVLTLCKGSVATKGHLPILKNVLLEHRGGSLFVATTNLDQATARSIDCGGDEDGAITVPHKEFAAYVKLMPKGTILTLSRDWRRERLEIACGSSTATLQGMTAADFPAVAGFDATPYEERDASEKEALEQEREEAAAEERRKEAEARALIAAQPDRFIYTYQVGYRELETMEFAALDAALTQWHTDFHGGTREPDGAARWGKHITDKFGNKVVMSDYDMERQRLELQAEPEKGRVTLIEAEAAASVRLDGETQTFAPSGPPPGTPCDDIVVAIAPSEPHPVVVQEQEQEQAAQRDTTLEQRAERAIVAARAAVAKASTGPRVLKHRFGYRPETIEKFFARAIRAGVTVKVANRVKHDGDLLEFVPLFINDEAFVVKQGENVIPLAKSGVKYLEAVC